MKIYFRTNYNLEIGIGNLSRINKIFNLLSKYYDCKILIDRYLPNIPFKIKKNSFIELYPNKKKFLSQKNDALNIVSKFKKCRNKKKIIFVDDYRMKYQWEKELSKNKFIIITIDDFINNKHYSDYYINTKLDLIDKDIEKKIKKNNKKNCKFFLGPKYAFINPKNLKKKLENKKFNITFYSGGSGNILMYKNVFEYFKNNNNFNLNIIVGPYSRNTINYYLVYFKEFKNIKLFFSPKNIDKILVKTHLLLSTAGLMMYEASNRNVISIFFRINKNQEFNRNFLKYINQIFILNYYQVSSKKLLILINLVISKFNILKKKLFINQNNFLGYKKIILKIINNENKK